MKEFQKITYTWNGGLLSSTSTTTLKRLTGMLLLCWCFMTLRHILGHFRRSQLTYPHCSSASLLDSLPVLTAHSFVSTWQLLFLNQRKGENGHRNYFMIKLHERMLPDVRIEPVTICIAGGRTSNRATVTGTFRGTMMFKRQKDASKKMSWCHAGGYPHAGSERSFSSNFKLSCFLYI